MVGVNMKLKKLFHIPKEISRQTLMYAVSDKILLQYFSNSPFEKAIGEASGGLMQIDLIEKNIAQLTGKKLSLLHMRQKVYYFLEEWYEDGVELAWLKRFDYETKGWIVSSPMHELCGSLENRSRLQVMGNLFYLNNYMQFFILNASLEIIYKYKTWRSLDGVIYWNDQIVYSTESDGCQNSILMKHFLTEGKSESYPIETFFSKREKGNALNCFKTAEKYLLIEVDSYPRRMVVLDENEKVVFRTGEYIEKIYFVHPKRKEALFFKPDKESRTGIYVYKNWETGAVLWEISLTENFDVNWYDRRPYFWEQKEKFIFNGFKNNKTGFWVIDVRTAEKEFFKPVDSFGEHTSGSIALKKSYAVINTVSAGKRNYYYKLE